MAAAAPAANVTEMKQKRQREDLPNYDDSYSCDDENDQNPQKRPRHGFLPKFRWSDVSEDLGTVQGELVLNLMKELEQEIRSSEMSITNEYNQIERNSKSTNKDHDGEVEETVASTSSFEYLGMPPSPPVSVDTNDDPIFSQKFWSDLFENPSSESAATAENVGTLQPCLYYCYSSNYRDYGVYSVVYSGVVAEWTEAAFTDWILEGCMTVF